MLQKYLPLMLTLSLSSLVACQPVPIIPTENRSSTPPGARPSPTISSQPPAPTTRPPQPQPSVAAPNTPVQVTVPLPEGARLELSLPIRFFDTPGQQTQIRVRLLNAQGQEIPLDGRKWLFGNSRPQDFSLSETGLLTALSDSGFTEISVQLAGTDLRATQTVSVNGVTTFVSAGGTPPYHRPALPPNPAPRPSRRNRSQPPFTSKGSPEASSRSIANGGARLSPWPAMPMAIP